MPLSSDRGSANSACPLIRDGIEFHNVVELSPAVGGLALQRFPRDVREHPQMNELGRLVMTKAAGAEIRFVTGGSRLRIALSALEEEARYYVFCGDFFHSELRVPPGETRHLLLERPLAPGYFTPARFSSCRFSPSQWRVWCGRSAAVFGGLESFGYEVRPPRPDEKPSVRWLAYGSSLTMGGNAVFQPGAYAGEAARHLGVDVLNLGMGGSCHLEQHVADHIAARTDWDFATLRVGCNMIGEFAPQEYRRRLEYALATILTVHPQKPLIVIGLSSKLLPFNREMKIWQDHTRAYEEINGEMAKQFPKVHFLSASDLMPDFNLLGSDMLHPSDAGHAQIGRNLAEVIRSTGISTPPIQPTR